MGISMSGDQIFRLLFDSLFVDNERKLIEKL